jgi:outer membrane protein assembly factor BamB
MCLSFRGKKSAVYSLVLACAMTLMLFVPSNGSVQAASVYRGHVQSSSDATAQQNTWPMYDFNARHTGVNPYETILSPKTVSKLVLAWNVPTDYSAEATQPAVGDGMIYYGSGDVLSAFNMQTGATVWQVTFPGNFTDITSPIYSHSIVYFCPYSGGVYAYEAATGKLLWHRPIPPHGATTNASPLLANGVLYDEWDGQLYAINAQTSDVLWHVPISMLYAAPAYAEGILYVTSGLYLFAIDAKTGKKLWKVEDGGYNNSAPTIVNGVAFVAGGSPDGYYQANLSAFNAQTGKLIWTDSINNGVPFISSPLSLAVLNGKLYLYSGDIYVYSTKTGAFLWKTMTGNQGEEPGSSVAIANGVMYAGEPDQNLYAFNAHTGATLWSYQTGGAIYALPVVVNGMVFVGSSNGQLYAFHLSS